jgi:hypothetical protein
MPKKPGFGPRKSKTEEEKQLLLGLVRTWTEAAAVCAMVANDNTRPPAGLGAQ